MRASLVFLAITAFALLPACAKKKEQSFVSPIFTIPTESLPEAQHYAAHPIISCADPKGECNQAVGMLTRASGKSTGVCTATLISADIAVTNSHCIPDELKLPASDCRKRIWLSFPASPAHPELDRQAECRSVIHASTILNDEPHPDYAFIRLDRSLNRKPLKLSREGFRDGEGVVITKVDPSFRDGVAYGVMQSISCKTVLGSMALPQGLEELSDLLLFSDCKIIQGNSGSAIRSSDGSVKGIIQAFFKTEGVRERLQQRGYRIWDNEIAELNLGTSFACFDGLPLGQKNPHCGDRMSQEEREDFFSAARSNALLADFDSIMKSKLAQPEQLEWRAELRSSYSLAPDASGIGSRSRTLVVPRPACVNQSKALESRYAYSLKVPQFELVQGVDRYLRDRRRLLSFGDDLAASLILEKRDVNLWHVTQEFAPSGLDAPENSEGDLPACSRN